MRFLFLVTLTYLVSCSRVADLSVEDKYEFEDLWWEIDCAFQECPLCFKLNKDHTVETYDLDIGSYETYGEWSFQEPNTYYFELYDKTYRIFVEPSGSCFDLSYSIIKMEACECSIPLL